MADIPRFLLDTNVMRGIGRPQLAVLMEWCRTRRIQVIIPQWCLWEHARQEYDEPRLSDPVLTKEAQKQHIDPRDTRLAEMHYLRVHGTWEEAGALILMQRDLPGQISREILEDAARLFTKSDGNEERDRQIWLAVVLMMTPGDDLTCFVQDKTLRKALEEKGFSCEPGMPDCMLGELKSYRPSLSLKYNVEADSNTIDGAFRSQLVSVDPHYAAWVKEEAGDLDPEKVRATDEMLARLEREATNVRHVIMSYAYWLEGVSRDTLIEALTGMQFSEDIVVHHLMELCKIGVLNEVEDLLLPDTNGFCETIAHQRIDDVDAILGRL